MAWFLAEDDTTPGQYVSDVQGGQPVWTTDPEQAAWATKKPPVDRYIQNNGLQNVTAKTGPGGNHPGTKPPIA